MRDNFSFDFRIRSFLTGILLVTLLTSSSMAIGRPQVIAVTGDHAPDGNGRFSTIETTPTINNSGQVAFLASFSDTIREFPDGGGVLRGDGTTLILMARTGQLVLNGSSRLFLNPSVAVSDVTINDAGQVGFYSRAIPISISIGNSHIFRSDGVQLTQLVSEGQAVPNSNGIIASNGLEYHAFNNAGEAAFLAQLSGTNRADNNVGIFLSDGGTMSQIVRAGDSIPDGNSTFSYFFGPNLNNAGQVAFTTNLTGQAIGGGPKRNGIYRGDASGNLVQIAREGQAAPNGDGVFTDVFGHSINNSGQVAFAGSITGAGGGSSDVHGIFRGDGQMVTQIALSGQNAPDGDGNFLSLGGEPIINNVGQVLFRANISANTDSAVYRGLFRGDGVSVSQIARAGQDVPDGNGIFSQFILPELNQRGQVAFIARITNTSDGIDQRGLYFYDESLGVQLVNRVGNTFLGSTISSLLINNNYYSDERRGLNDRGQVAYQFELADGRSGVALWTIPEPSSTVLFLMGCLVLFRRDRNEPA